MNDEQSFYEIQLNTPHLVLAVLGAAVVGVAVFWLGVVIGRGQTEPTMSGDWQAAVPGESETGDDGEPLGFYESVGEGQDEDGASGSAPPAQEPVAEEPVAEEPATTPPPSSEIAAPEFQPSEPVQEQPAPVQAESQAGLPSPDASLPSGWIVQVRSTPEKPAADALQAALASAGFPAFVVSAEVSGQTYYRVRVGRYRSRGDAETIERELLGRSDIDTTWVTEG